MKLALATPIRQDVVDIVDDEMIGSCVEMRAVHYVIAGVAKTDSTVLVLGESGTGKELVARAIHRRSRRADKPLVSVNCGAIPYDLIESELFGHTRGAFTSAHSARAGLFEAAHGGTLFLDEVGDLPVAAQVKLLRVLESGEVKPVGSDTSKTVDVRVIAATNANLKASITAGTFRQDLYYRLNVIAVKLPPLRERGNDVLALATHFVGKYADRAGRPPPTISSEAADVLRRHRWPGNVRELEHAIERALILDPSEELTESSFPPEMMGVPSRRPTVVPIYSRLPSSAKPASIAETVAALGLPNLAFADAKKRVVEEFTDAYVTQVLKTTGGNVSEAARRSGLDRSNFRRLLKK